MSSYINQQLRRSVEARAKQCCEYCKMPSCIAYIPHEVDHMIAEKHGGKTESDNLAYACWRCNRHKGTDLGSFDPKTQEFSFLYNPRRQEWAEHFQQIKWQIQGITPEGRTTVELLQFNRADRIAERQRYLHA
jgi:5-methylcytosine-specific restriction endonuclease McrA